MHARIPKPATSRKNAIARAVIDTLEPRTLLASIAATTPSNGKQLVSISANLTVRFNEPMNAGSLNASTIRLTDAAGNAVPAALSYDAGSKTVTIDPVANLSTGNSYYTLRVVGGGSGVKDSQAGPLAKDYAVHFTTGTPSFSETTLFPNLINPTAMEFAPDGRVFIAEKRGVIKVYDNLADTTPTVFADFRTKVHNYWDRGLLGLALDPGFANGRPYIYVLYTYDGDIGGGAPKWGTANTDSDPGSADGNSTVSARLGRLTASGNVMTGAEQVLVHDWQNQYPSHGIGDLQFGPDGYLYASAGDGASFNGVDYGQNNVFNDPVKEGGALRSQDLLSPGDAQTLDGTVIRIHPDTGAPAPNNPYASRADVNAKRIIASGLRNPYRFTFRPGTSEIWIAETGWNNYEEINRIVNSSDTAAENFGWPAYEGPNPQAGYQSANLPLLNGLFAQGPGAVEMPYFYYAHGEKVVPGSSELTGGSSPTGIVFYTGGALPDAYHDAMFFTDYSRKQIYVMYAGPDGLPDISTRQIFRPLTNSPVDLIEGPDGALYWVDFYNGRVGRIAYDGSGAIATNGKLTGAVIGTPGTSGNGAGSAFDGDLSSFFGGSSASGAWAGLDLGNARWVRQIKFAPRLGEALRMVGGRFQGSNDANFASGVVDLYTITSAPAQGVLTSVAVNPTGANYRYVRYIGADGTFSDVAEIEFHAGAGLPATYYNNPDFTGTTATRTDPTVNFTWGDGAPAGGIAAHSFSVRWQGKIQAAEGGAYTFRTTAGGGVRLWINGMLVIDNFIDQPPTSYSNTINLAAGGIYDIRIDYFNGSAGAAMQLEWQRPGGTMEIVPTSALFNAGPSGNQGPTPVIASPAGTLKWKVGDPITFSGTATDAEDGALPASALRWSLVLVHGNEIDPTNTHEHLLQTFDGVATGSFVGPDHEYPSWIELRLTATDSAGVSTTVSRRIDPLGVAITLNSNVPGVMLSFNSGSAASPVTRNVMAGSANTVSAPAQVVINGQTYLFTGWSDGGAPTHSIVAPSVATTLTANYALPQAPDAPTTLIATPASTTQINLTWVDNAGTETGYRVERRVVGGIFAPVTTLGANAVAFSDTGLTPGTTYEYRVLALNAGGDSAASNIAIATTVSPLVVPASPTALIASNITTTSVVLSWADNASNEAGYRVERRLAGGTWASLPGALAENATTFTDTGLAPATAYEYRVRAFNGAGDSAASNVVAVATLSTATVPAVPAALTGVVDAGPQVQLTWQDLSNNETSFKIERRYAGWIWGDLATVGANVATYRDTTAINNVTYEYRVSAVNALGASGPSGGVIVNTANIGTVPPAAPANLTAVAASGTLINLAWQDLATDETAYQIERRLPGGTFALLATVGANAVSYSDATVAGGTTYEYRVRALRGAVSGAYGNTATASTPGLPVAPANLTATASSGTLVNLAWQDVATDETGYKIERRLLGGTFAQIAVTNANVVAFADSTVLAGNVYEYRIRAVRGTTDGLYGNIATVTTPGGAGGVPAAPSTFTAVLTTKPRVQMTWKDNSTNETAFIVQRRYAGWIWGDVATVAANTTSYLDTSGISNVTYEYRVVAMNGSGNSPFSNSVIVNTA